MINKYREEAEESELHPYRHVYLYAKGYYEQGNIWDDLRAIISERSGIPSQYVSEEDIVVVLSEIAWPLMNFDGFLSFINDIRPENTWYIGYTHKDTIIMGDDAPRREYNTLEAIVRKLLKIIRWAKVLNINLGSPDETLLPIGE